MYDMKALYEAESVEHAIQLRLEHPEAQIIAGGSDVLVQMREGKRAGKELISIYMIDAMHGVSIDEDENIRIGSLTSFSHITKDPIIQKYINVLGEAVDQVGSPQIRNIGTIGGNTCNGVTSADSASTLHAWEAIVELTGKNGVRRLPIRDFYIKAGVVDIRADEGEIQTAILIPKASYENTFGHYIKYGMRNAMEIASLGCSVNVRLSEDKKTIDRCRIAYGVCDSIVFAAGQVTGLTPEFGIELNRFGYPIDPKTGKSELTTSVEGVFAAGDVITGTKFLIDAIAGARDVASLMDKYLGGDGEIDETLVERERDPEIGKIEGFAKIARNEMAVKPAAERRDNFEPISDGFTCDQAACESGRCLQCDLRKDIQCVKMWPEYSIK